MTEQDPKNYWLDLIDHQAESGLTIAAFCEKHEISRYKFYYWRKRLCKSKKPNKGFVQLIPNSHSESGIKVHLSESVYIEVQPGFDPQTLQDVMKALGGPLCSA
jgi:hypothetical protein